MAKTLEDTGLATREEVGSELAPTAVAAQAQYEIQSAIVIARRFPRNEDAAFGKLMTACDRPSFAQEAEYVFPRGDAKISGPSVNVAREAARIWGNIRYGLYVVRDDEDSRQIRGFAWDLESNSKVEAEDDFQKLVYRKRDGGGWVKPDERDLRELTNRRGAILVRNCLLQLLPRDLIEDAIQRCRETLKKDASANPEAARKKLILAFGDIGVNVSMLESRLRHPIGESSPAELAELRAIYSSIKDGNSKWREYAEGRSGQEGQSGKIDMADLKEKKQAADPKKGAEPEQPKSSGSGRYVNAAKQKQLIAEWEAAGAHYDDLSPWLEQYGVPGGAISRITASKFDELMITIGNMERPAK